MITLHFDPQICWKCPTKDCLVRCRYQELDLDQARVEKEKILSGTFSQVLENCHTCYACEEYCPNSNHPFYQLVELQERLGILNVPRPLFKQQARMMGPRERIAQEKLTPPIIDMCLFPMLLDSIQGRLYEGVSIIHGSDIFCNIMWLHFANMSLIKERLPVMISNIWEYYLRPSEVDELICYHDECYGAFTHLAPAYGISVPFKPIHLFNFLTRRLVELKRFIKPLGAKVAYQRPCSNRLIPETGDLVDEIFYHLGAERPKRAYDRENSLCCGGVLRMQQKDDEADRILAENIKDMRKTGVDYCVFNCPMCLMTMGEEVAAAGIFPILMSDLCKVALGEL